ncbi:MAG: sulfate adenylyltransferase [Rhodospirillaceae bacterium]|nr:sulfate adenylyltransferase [Rhodospirillaceae bacterium]
MNHIQALESESIFILREAYKNCAKTGLLWSLGKDSCVLIWLAKKAFLGKVPFPVIHLDTGKEFPETYEFKKLYTKIWELDLISDMCPSIEEVDPSLPPASRFAARKSLGLKDTIKKYDFQALIAGIRRDEQATRAKERVFSPRDSKNEWDFRDQPPEFWNQYNLSFPSGTHIRIHPLLQWTEIDIWRYIEKEKIPMVPLYFSNNGRRYRSLGEIGITESMSSEAKTVAEIIEELENIKTPERAGRTMDHESEDSFERLRATGYL